jgi:hypothetical protein
VKDEEAKVGGSGLSYERREYIDVKVSADNDQGDVLFTAYLDGYDHPATVIRLDAFAALQLLQDMTGHALRAAQEQVDAWRLGDCPECGNTRMVKVPAPGGRTERVHCPRCSVRPGRADYPKWHPRTAAVVGVTEDREG